MRKRRGKTAIDESFDAGHPVAEVIRSLLPSETRMSDEARERMMGHLLAVRRRVARGAPARPGSRPRRIRKTALVTAAAVLVLAAVLTAVLLPIHFGGGTKTARQFARLQSPDGKVEVMPSGGKWRAAEDGERLASGWRVRAGDDSFASVAFPEGSIMRLTDGSEALLEAIGKQSVTVGHLTGGTYHRVRAGTRYLVSNRGISARALGTAFSVESREPGNLEILSVENAVEVEIGKHQPIKVFEGEVMVVSMAQAKQAVKQPVSRERLADRRLCASVQKDVEKGYSSGIYEKLDVPIEAQPASQDQTVSEDFPVTLGGVAAESGAALEWTVSASIGFDALVLLRSELSEPGYPDDEIARYADTSIKSATDDSTTRGRTYQYRLVALSGAGVPVAYSNTLVMSVSESGARPEPVSVTLRGSLLRGGISLEWSVTGASVFSGFVLERVVEKAPGGSVTPAGSASSRRIDSASVFFTFVDDSVAAGHVYSYRVGLVVDGAAMVYSDTVTLEVKP